MYTDSKLKSNLGEISHYATEQSPERSYSAQRRSFKMQKMLQTTTSNEQVASE